MREPPPSAPTYDIPGAISSTIDDEGPNTLIPMVTTSDADYEQPAPCEYLDSCEQPFEYLDNCEQPCE